MISLLPYPAQYRKIKLCATCFCLREDFCKERLCLYPDIWNERISSRDTRISPKFSKRQFQRVLRGKETVYIPGMYCDPLVNHLQSSCWLWQAAWPCKGICREPSKGFPPTVRDEKMTSDGNFMYYPQKTEVFAFWTWKSHHQQNPNQQQKTSELFCNNLVFQHPRRSNSPANTRAD